MTCLRRRFLFLVSLALVLYIAPAPADDQEVLLEAWQRQQNACSQFTFEENYPLATAACAAAAATAERLEPGPQLDGSLNDLAMVLLRQQRWEQAEIILKRILDIRAKTLGPDHVMTAGTLALLGAVYRKTGRDEAAGKISAEVGRITGNCQGLLSEEQREGIAGANAPDPCAHETLPEFLR